MNDPQIAYTEDIYRQWEEVAEFGSLLTDEDRVTRLTVILNQLRTDNAWTAPYPDCELIATAIFYALVPQRKFAEAITQIDTLQTHPDFKGFTLPSHLIGLSGDVESIRSLLGDLTQKDQIIAKLKDQTYKPESILQFLVKHVWLYDQNDPLPAQLKTICLDLAPYSPQQAEITQAANIASTPADLLDRLVNLIRS